MCYLQQLNTWLMPESQCIACTEGREISNLLHRHMNTNSVDNGLTFVFSFGNVNNKQSIKMMMSGMEYAEI
jgi:hypothetical protein